MNQSIHLGRAGVHITDRSACASIHGVGDVRETVRPITLESGETVWSRAIRAEAADGVVVEFTIYAHSRDALFPAEEQSKTPEAA